MQVNLYKLYTTYLVNIFATLHNLKLTLQECNHYCHFIYFSICDIITCAIFICDIFT